MPKTLSETAIVLITNAAMRTDLKVLPVPKGLKAPAVVVRKTLTTLLKDGLLAEVRAGRDDAVWEQSEERGRMTLVATEAGLRAVGIESDESLTTESTDAGSKPSKTRRGSARASKTAQRPTSRPPAAKRPKQATSASRTKKVARGAAVGETGGRQTKQSIIVAMLRRGGASIAEMATATGWQNHSVRGVLTATVKGKLGLPLVSEKGEDGVRRYHIAALRNGGGEK